MGHPFLSHLTLARVAVAVLTLASLSACTATGSTGPDGSSAPAATPVSPAAGPSSSPAAAPGASGQTTLPPATALLRDKVAQALKDLAASSPKPSRDQMVAALTGAGIGSNGLEVSISRTPTGLEVDAIEAAALEGKDCVIGQVRDGRVSIVILPVLASGKCFVGTQL